MPKYQSKPTVIEAEQFFADKPLPFADRGPYVGYKDERFYVMTAHRQTVDLVDGDWVVIEAPCSTGVPFAAYPCKPDIFASQYSLVE